MKDQIVFVSGGLSFRDRNQAIEYYKKRNIDEVWGGKSWREWLFWTLEDSYEFIFPSMPAKDNADYELWKIIFEKYLAKITSDQPIFIGYSLGTIFLCKYLLENGLNKKLKELHLVAPIISNSFQEEGDPEDTGTFTFDITKAKDLGNLAERIHIWHSKDDTLCSIKNAEYLKSEIPQAELHIFENRNHFLQTTFFELFDVLRK